MSIDRRAARAVAQLCRTFEGDYNYPAGLFQRAAETIEQLVDELEQLEQREGKTDEVSTMPNGNDGEPIA